MRPPILLIAVAISTAWAQTNVERPFRAPQGQSKYDEIDGSLINRRKYVTPEQWRSQLANTQQSQHGSSHHFRQTQEAAASQHHGPAPQAQPQSQQTQQAQTPQYYSYKPYSAVPGHIRQLINSVYQPQAPYVDPTSFLYGSGYASPQQPAPAASEIPRTAYLQPSAKYQMIDQRYNDRAERQDKVVYKEDYEQQQEQQTPTFPLAALPDPPAPTLYLDKNMPTAIKQLLEYQAQIPYDVTANRIRYRPKNIFIPRPLSDDDKGPNYYRSKIYYPNENAEYSQDKTVDEDQRH